MERRYLVAAVALVATFVLFSHVLRSARGAAFFWHLAGSGAVGASCPFARASAAGLLGRVESHLRPSHPEEAQLLAEMNLPVPPAPPVPPVAVPAVPSARQIEAIQVMAARQAAVAQCAREHALRAAARARREAERARRQAERAKADAVVEPIVFKMDSADMEPMSGSHNVRVIEFTPARVRAQVEAQMAAAKAGLALAKVQLASAGFGDLTVENPGFDKAVDASTLQKVFAKSGAALLQ